MCVGRCVRGWCVCEGVCGWGEGIIIAAYLHKQYHGIISTFIVDQLA